MSVTASLGRHSVPELAMSVSAAWARASRRGRPRNPQVPLIVDRPEDVAQDRLLFVPAARPDKLGVDRIEVLTRFGRNSRRRSSMTMTQTHKTQYSTSHCHRNGFQFIAKTRICIRASDLSRPSCCRCSMIVTSSPSIGGHLHAGRPAHHAGIEDLDAVSVDRPVLGRTGEQRLGVRRDTGR